MSKTRTSWFEAVAPPDTEDEKNPILESFKKDVKEEDEERRFEESFAQSVKSPEDQAALNLAKPGLTSDVNRAKLHYRKLGRALDTPIDRKNRRIVVAARRILEDVHGMGALRDEPKPADHITVRIQYPDRREIKKGSLSAEMKGISVQDLASPFVGVTFDKRTEARGKGVVVERLIDPQLHYGEDAYAKSQNALAEKLLRESNKLKAKVEKLRKEGKEIPEALRNKVEENEKSKKKFVEDHKKMLASIQRRFGIEESPPTVPEITPPKITEEPVAPKPEMKYGTRVRHVVGPERLPSEKGDGKFIGTVEDDGKVVARVRFDKVPNRVQMVDLDALDPI